MIHYSCTENPTARCLREGRTSKRFPKPFRSETASIEVDNNVSYRRRSPEEGGEIDFRTGKNKNVGAMKIVVDYSWVVPHSYDFLQKFGTHMNVEFCISKL